MTSMLQKIELTLAVGNPRISYAYNINELNKQLLSSVPCHICE